MCPQLPQPHGNGSHFRPAQGEGQERGAVGIGIEGREMDTDGTLALALGGAWGAWDVVARRGVALSFRDWKS